MREKAESFRALHHGPLLVLPNAWDAASAQALAALPRCQAIATSSAATARALGYEDGERTPRSEMLEAVRRIAAAVDVPVSADLEAGYGDPEGTAALALESGAVGMNLEDSRGGSPVAIEDQAETIRRVRARAPELVLNARIDVFLHGTGQVDEAVERAEAYLAAGADCVFPIGAADAGEIEALAARIPGPVNILVTPRTPGIEELARLGVRRVTFGSGLAQAALAEAARVAAAAFAAVPVAR